MSSDDDMNYEDLWKWKTIENVSPKICLGWSYFLMVLTLSLRTMRKKFSKNSSFKIRSRLVFNLMFQLRKKRYCRKSMTWIFLWVVSWCRFSIEVWMESGDMGILWTCSRIETIFFILIKFINDGNVSKNCEWKSYIK